MVTVALAQVPGVREGQREAALPVADRWSRRRRLAVHGRRSTFAPWIPLRPI